MGQFMMISILKLVFSFEKQYFPPTAVRGIRSSCFCEVTMDTPGMLCWERDANRRDCRKDDFVVQKLEDVQIKINDLQRIECMLMD